MLVDTPSCCFFNTLLLGGHDISVDGSVMLVGLVVASDLTLLT